MKIWKLKHFVVIFIFGVAASAGGYLTGVILTNPPLDASSQQNLILLAVKNAVIEETGVADMKIEFLGRGDPYGSLTGDVLSVQPEEQYYLVNLQDQNSLKTSLIEGVEDRPHGDVEYVKIVEVKGDGTTEVLPVRI